MNEVEDLVGSNNRCNTDKLPWKQHKKRRRKSKIVNESLTREDIDRRTAIIWRTITHGRELGLVNWF